MKGLISNIQRFSLTDGDGIRTTVFFKGCNMKCNWCHNPETLSGAQELMFYAGQGEGAQGYVWIFGVVGVVVSEALAQIFFHFYNCQKHGSKAVKNELLSKGDGENDSAEAKADKKQKIFLNLFYLKY